MRSEHKFFYLAAVAFAVLMLLSAVSWLFYSKIKTTSKVISEAETTIMFLENKEKEFSKAAEELKETEEKIKIIESVFLREETFVEFVELLEGLARAAGVRIQVENAALAVSSPEPASISFAVESDFSGIINFLMLLDNIPISGIIDSAEILPQTRQEDEKKQSGALRIKARYIIFNFKK